MVGLVPVVGYVVNLFRYFTLFALGLLGGAEQFREQSFVSVCIAIYPLSATPISFASW